MAMYLETREARYERWEWKRSMRLESASAKGTKMVPRSDELMVPESSFAELIHQIRASDEQAAAWLAGSH
jgi:hypothetical protein